MDKNLLLVTVKTLIYFRIRGFNSTLLNLYNFLLKDKKYKIKINYDLDSLKLALQFLENENIVEKFKGSYLYKLELTDHLENIAPISQQKIAVKKIKSILFIVNFLKFIPLFRFIGINGTVASLNPKLQSDIDFFIVCKDKRIWTSRFFLILFLSVIKKRRTKSAVMNKVCLNSFINEKFLKMNERNLYTAFELVNMITLIDHKNIERKIVLSNLWVNDYFVRPFWDKDFIRAYDYGLRNYFKTLVQKEEKGFIYIFLDLIFNFLIFDFLEGFLAFLQIKRIRKKRKNNKGDHVYFGDDALIFHPKQKSKYYKKIFRGCWKNEKGKIHNLIFKKYLKIR